ncbi:MAG: hypothetical protein ACLSHC_18835 [Bilophila wadsworthia]
MAADKSASVILLDKANTKRSGAGATGNDHFLCYIPEKHGTIDVVYEEFMDSQNATSNDTPLVMRFLETSPTIVNMWNDWGINMKPTGDFHFEGHAYPGRPKIFLKYDGHNQKKVLTEQAKKRGVRIVNHCPCWNCSATITASPSTGPRYFLKRTSLSHREAVAGSRHGYVNVCSRPIPRRARCSARTCARRNLVTPSHRRGAWEPISSIWKRPTAIPGPVSRPLRQGHMDRRHRYPNGKPIGPFITK